MEHLWGLLNTLIGVAVGAHLAVWVEAQKGRVVRLGDETLRVEFKVLRKDKDGYFIPGEGRVAVDEALRAMAAERRGRIALICQEVTAMAEMVPNWVVLRIVPL